MEFLFGARSTRTEEFLEKDYSKYGDKYKITGAQIFRNRFDFIYNTAESQKLAVMWMKAFVRFMANLDPGHFQYIDVAYSTSHTIEEEIEKYSKVDLNYLFISLACMGVSFLVYMWLDTHSLKVQLRHRLKPTILLSMRLYLPFVVLAQIVFTNTAMFGFMTLIGVEANQFLITIAFIVILICCNQSLLLYKNLNKIFDCVLKENDNMSLLLGQLSSSSTDTKSDKSFLMIECLKLTFEVILIPQMYSCVTGVCVYLFLILTSCFEVIRIYCLFTSVALVFNLISLLIAYCPCLTIYLKQQIEKAKFLQQKTNRSPTATTDKYVELKQINSPLNQTTEPSLQEPQQQQIKAIPTTTLHNNQYENILINILFGTKIKYFLLLIFFTYFILNICLMLKHKVEMPILQLLPKQSYLYKHMDWHQKYFKLAPVIMIIFRGELKVWDTAEYDRYLHFINDAKHIDGISRNIELNWLTNLENTYGESTSNREQFYENFQYVVNDPIDQWDIVADVNITNTSINGITKFHKEISIKATRLFLQFDSFDGSEAQSIAFKALQTLAYDSYNYTHDQLWLYTAIGPYLEQINELRTSFFIICIIAIECIIFTQIFYIYDLRLIYINALITASILVSILSLMYLLNVSLNIVSLMQFLIIPAILNEYFSYINYTYKFNEIYFQTKQLNLIKFLFKNFLNISTVFLCFCLLSSFLLIFSQTYNFQILFKLFIALFLNFILHLYLFYPLLLRCFLKIKCNHQHFKEKNEKNPNNDTTLNLNDDTNEDDCERIDGKQQKARV